MKRLYILFGVFLILTTRLFAQEVLDKTVAIVEDNIILKSELYQFSYSTAHQLKIDHEKDKVKFDKLVSETLEL